MSNEQKIQELEQRIFVLAGNLEKYMQEILQLQQELNALKSGLPLPPADHKKIKAYKKKSFSFENFIGLKLIHFAGIIVLITGLSIGVKYAIDKELISPVLRIVLAYAAAVLLLFIAWRLKKNYTVFSMILFGGAMATAYFTTYGAFAYYNLLSNAIAFTVMVLLTIFTVYQALKYNRQEVAVLGLVGAYGIPFLVRGNNENVLLLFAYISLVNIGVLFLLFKKYWFWLIYLSFSVTWIIFLSWVFFANNPQHNTGIGFSIFFFILFAVGTIAFKMVHGLHISRDDVTIFLLNVLAFYFALMLLRREAVFTNPTTLTLLFGIAAIACFFIVKYRLPQQLFFRNSLLLLGMLMLIIFVPMKYDRLSITFIWVVMAVILFVAGIWQKNKLLRICAIGLFAVTLIKLIFADSLRFTPLQKIIAYIVIGTFLLVISFLYQKYRGIIFGSGAE